MTKKEIVAELTTMLRLDDPYWKHYMSAAESMSNDIKRLIKKIEETDNEEK